MPELPEVETVRNTLKHLVVGEEIIDVDILYERIIKHPMVALFKNKSGWANSRCFTLREIFNF